MEDSIAKCEIDEKGALFKLELKKGIVGGIVYVTHTSKFRLRKVLEDGTRQRSYREEWEVSSAYVGLSPTRPRRWGDTLDKRGIERPDET